MKRKLTIEAVQTAISELKEQGKKPTNQLIIDFLGFGSFSTLTQMRKENPNIFGIAPKNTFQNTVDNTLGETLINTVWQGIEAKVDLRIQEILGSQYTSESLKKNDPTLKNVKQLESNLTAQRSQNETLKIKNNDLEARLNIIQVDAQKTIDELTKKLDDSRNEITRQAKEYSDLQAKYASLKASSPVTEKIKRGPVVLDSEASQIDDDFILGTIKAKTRAKALVKQGFNDIDIATRLVSEGYRKKGITGDFKAYTSKEITKWLK